MKMLTRKTIMAGALAFAVAGCSRDGLPVPMVDMMKGGSADLGTAPQACVSKKVCGVYGTGNVYAITEVYKVRDSEGREYTEKLEIAETSDPPQRFIVSANFSDEKGNGISTAATDKRVPVKFLPVDGNSIDNEDYYLVGNDGNGVTLATERAGKVVTIKDSFQAGCYRYVLDDAGDAATVGILDVNGQPVTSIAIKADTTDHVTINEGEQQVTIPVRVNTVVPGVSADVRVLETEVTFSNDSAILPISINGQVQNNVTAKVTRDTKGNLSEIDVPGTGDVLPADTTFDYCSVR